MGTYVTTGPHKRRADIDMLGIADEDLMDGFVVIDDGDFHFTISTR